MPGRLKKASVVPEKASTSTLAPCQPFSLPFRTKQLHHSRGMPASAHDRDFGTTVVSKSIPCLPLRFCTKASRCCGVAPFSPSDAKRRSVACTSLCVTLLFALIFRICSIVFSSCCDCGGGACFCLCTCACASKRLGSSIFSTGVRCSYSPSTNPLNPVVEWKP